jgi:hypothetical protein
LLSLLKAVVFLLIKGLETPAFYSSSAFCPFI